MNWITYNSVEDFGVSWGSNFSFQIEKHVEQPWKHKSTGIFKIVRW